MSKWKYIIKFSNRRKILIIICLFIFGFSFLYFSERPEFCKSCHEIEFYYNTWTESTHHNEANCLECHTEPGVKGFIDVRIRGLNELIKHILGNYEVPIQANIRVKNSQCLKCHPEADNIPDLSVDANHALHMEKYVLCADCHSRIVHTFVEDEKIIRIDHCDDCHESHLEFPFQGKHSSLRCGECHIDLIYEDVTSLCQDCHKTPIDHVDVVYTNCEKCHSDSDWNVIKFDHTTTQLKDGHSNLICQDCHQPETYEGLSPNCESCHNPPTLHLATYNQTCDKCHNISNWSQTEFDHSFYELSGKHGRVMCNECHSEGQYEAISTLCQDCHEAPVDHGLDISETCDLCHSTNDWTIITFNHDIFPLTERHLDLDCVECHTDKHYETTSTLCESCHKAPSDHEVNINSDCELCHTTSGWLPAAFDHSTYPLSGAHIDVSCDECHKGNVYTGTYRECIDCHPEPEYHSGLPNCAQCHTPTSFQISTYRHPRIEEHYPIGDKRLDCNDCHKTTYSEYSCRGSGCHSSTNSIDD